MRETVDLAPEHVSAYALTIEPSTPLGRKVQHGAVPPPDPDLQADMFELACEVLADAGTSTMRSRTGPSRASRVSTTSGTGSDVRISGSAPAPIRTATTGRWWNVRPPEEYLSLVAGTLPVGGEERLEPSDAYLEEVFLRLRILEGVPSSWVEPQRWRRSWRAVCSSTKTAR